MIVSSPSTPLITFALLAYNQERYIRDAVDGALAQTHSPLEIILSDDCSGDETFEIIREIANAYDGPHEIVLNRNPVNLGIGSHVNKIFELASGEWVVLAAGDDISFPNRVEKITKARAQYSEITACFSDAEFINEYGERNLGSFAAFDETTTLGLEQMIKGLGGLGAGATYAYDRRVYSKFEPLNKLIVAEDRILPLRASMLGDVLYIPEKLILYRKLSNSLSGVIANDVLLDLDRPTTRATIFWKSLLDDLDHGYSTGFIEKAQYESASATLDQARAIIRYRCQSARWNPFVRILGIAGLVKMLAAPRLAFTTNNIMKWIMLSLLGPLGLVIQKCRQFIRKSKKQSSFLTDTQHN